MNRLTAVMLCAASVSLAGSAAAQFASGGGPIDMSANELELVDAQHLAVWRGDVEALQGRNRMRADVLNIYFNGEASAASAAPSTKAWLPLSRP